MNYPALPGNRYETLARKYLPRGAGGILTFGVKGGSEGGRAFIEAVQFLSHLANVGDAKTLVIHPASTTHRQLSEDEQRAAGVTPEMIRLSVGLETLDDILWDIDQALARRKHDRTMRSPHHDSLRRHSLAARRSFPRASRWSARRRCCNALGTNRRCADDLPDAGLDRRRDLARAHPAAAAAAGVPAGLSSSAPG